MNKGQMLNLMVRLATIDQELAGRESSWIVRLGQKHGLSSEEITNAFRSQEEPYRLDLLAEEERFEYLYNLIQLMKIDGKIFLSEIDYCERVAYKLGYKGGVVKALSGHIYSDPSITANRKLLMEKAKSYLVISY
ncbi:hypothetical protein D770_03205 [Flammeovirgaceae bacterium 311]|nr:hypothetical protein D770_03205 [Flammeovirgaceae bacterium 311]